MYESIEITGYRGIKRLKLDGLSRVNLLVGKNNSGKTSVLEAIELQTSGDFSALTAAQFRRGERHPEDEGRSEFSLYDLRQVFHGRSLEVGSTFAIEQTPAEGGETSRLECTVAEGISKPDFKNVGGTRLQAVFEDSFALSIRPGSGKESGKVLVSQSGAQAMSGGWTRPRRTLKPYTPVQMVTTDREVDKELLREWRDIVLTDSEAVVVEALQIIEPRLQRVAVLDGAESTSTSVLVKLDGHPSTLPLGNLGEGMWRMLLIAIALVRSAGGVLLVDEIDTGFHHTILQDLWKLVSRTAERLGVQVFATTHSNDCVAALAAAIEEHDLAGHAALHRIEKDRPESVRYSEAEIVAAARHGTEVR